jgi:mRNA-degrading endonuclease RelE of RelBE toxin-antitoxin system
VSNYSVQVKPAARKELEVLPDGVLARVVKKSSLWAKCHGPRDAKSSKATKISGASGWVTGGWCTSFDDAATLVSVTRIGHRREVYER